MKYLLAPLLVLCAGCAASQAAMDQFAADILTLQEKPYIEAADFDVLIADVAGVKKAVKEDKDNFLEGLSDTGAATGVGGLLAVGIAAAQFYRNRNLPGSTRLPKNGA